MPCSRWGEEKQFFKLPDFHRIMPTANTRLTRLLKYGFYPVELPPPFSTNRYDTIQNIFSPPREYYGSTMFFDGANFNGDLRTFGIINPVSYFLLAQFLATNWPDISKIFKLSYCSGARPKFPNTKAIGRAIEEAPIIKNRQNQQHLSSSFPIILSLDINRFYQSIYTHSIPWAVLGKELAKQKYRDRTLRTEWSDKLDYLVRNCNQRQTIGIPIGPDTSRIISELILSRIDSELVKSNNGIRSGQIFHVIDDYKIGVFDHSAAERAKSEFIRTISRYELRLNDFKTSIDHGFEDAPSNFQREFDVLKGKREADFVEHFFEILFNKILEYPQRNVLGHSIKRFARRLASNSARDLVQEYLQRTIFAAPHQARWVFPVLLGINF